MLSSRFRGTLLLATNHYHINILHMFIVVRCITCTYNIHITFILLLDASPAHSLLKKGIYCSQARCIYSYTYIYAFICIHTFINVFLIPPTSACSHADCIPFCCQASPKPAAKAAAMPEEALYQRAMVTYRFLYIIVGLV